MDTASSGRCSMTDHVNGNNAWDLSLWQASASLGEEQRASSPNASAEGCPDRARGSSLASHCEAFRRRVLAAHPDAGGTAAALRAVLAGFYASVCQKVSAKAAWSSAPQDRHGSDFSQPCCSGSKCLEARPSRNQALERLVLALQGAGREQRFAALEELSAPLRVALRAFMLQHATAMKLGLAQSAKQSPRPRSCILRRSKGRCSIERVQRERGLQYRVAVHCPALDVVIKTRYVSTLEAAADMCAALTIAAVPLTHGGDLATAPAKLQTGLALACSEVGLNVADLCLSFCVRLKCPCVRGRVDGLWTSSLADALSQRRQLLARRAAWPGLRAQLIAIRRGTTRRRMRSLEDQEASHQVDATYSHRVCSKLRRCVEAAERDMQADARSRRLRVERTAGTGKRHRTDTANRDA